MSPGPLDGSLGNRLLDRLPKGVASRLVSAGQPATWQQGDIVHRQDGPTPDVHFPTCGCCCHIVTLDEGRRVLPIGCLKSVLHRLAQKIHV